MMEYELLARAVAHTAHQAVKQVRKKELMANGQPEPYYFHPFRVASLVKMWEEGNDDAISAAYLHDVLEDTGVTADDLLHYFPARIVDLVKEVTEISKPGDGNRAIRKEIDRLHYQSASPNGQTIKIADMIDNTRSIVKTDKDFAVVYMKEMRKLLDGLTLGNPDLWVIANLQLLEWEQRPR